MKTFKEFINEGLRDKMVGKSDNEILKSLEKLSDSDKIIAIIKYQLDYSLLPTKLDSNGVPNNLVVKGDLDCGNNQLTRLPDNLVVNGNLYCFNNQLTELPNNLIVKGDLWCYNNKVKLNLPKDAKIGGNFYN